MGVTQPWVTPQLPVAPGPVPSASVMEPSASHPATVAPLLTIAALPAIVALDQELLHQPEGIVLQNHMSRGLEVEREALKARAHFEEAAGEMTCR